MKDYWTTAGGERISYCELDDDHLQAILDDGYRNHMIIMEAIDRGMDIPERAVEEMTFADMHKWIESFNSCALSGNKFAEEMINLYENNYSVFLLRLNRLLEENKTI